VISLLSIAETRLSQETRDSVPLLDVRGLRKHFIRKPVFRWQKGSIVRAVDGVDFKLAKGKTMGLVGESGCGKTTTGRMLLRLEEPTDGAIMIDGQDIASLNGQQLKAYRRRVQMIFQDPYASLDPASRRDSVSEPLDVQARLEANGPSGPIRCRARWSPALGTRQASSAADDNAWVARALALSPSIIVADEPTSALDVSVGTGDQLPRLQDDLHLSHVFISHDLSTVRHISDEITVIMGKTAEQAPSGVVEEPLHHRRYSRGACARPGAGVPSRGPCWRASYPALPTHPAAVVSHALSTGYRAVRIGRAIAIARGTDARWPATAYELRNTGPAPDWRNK
jgi:ABC-type glutathione transport system ATPase component